MSCSLVSDSQVYEDCRGGELHHRRHRLLVVRFFMGPLFPGNCTHHSIGVPCLT